jgi:hypothetical protein
MTTDSQTSIEKRITLVLLLIECRLGEIVRELPSDAVLEMVKWRMEIPNRSSASHTKTCAAPTCLDLQTLFTELRLTAARSPFTSDKHNYLPCELCVGNI